MYVQAFLVFSINYNVNYASQKQYTCRKKFIASLRLQEFQQGAIFKFFRNTSYCLRLG